ncbi:MAG: SAM-dependent chlorinase/fluorinase [Patescibacteria group bacterium]|nr:SAM-dependent chlorinase/fluorinase [Patescibacteria group bacterium]
MRKLVVIADWAEDSLSCAEVKIAVNGYLKVQEKADISFVASKPSTIHTSFLVNQIVEDVEIFSSPKEVVIFQNTDPRLNYSSPTKKAEGAKALILRLYSGIYVLGPNSGYDFSLIKKKIEKVYHYTGVNEEGQFHSRDLYARICAHLMNYLEDELELEEASIVEIPDLEGYYIGHIDNFGNIKTTITYEDFKGRYAYGDLVKIKINNVTKEARYVSNLFGGYPGELVIYPGSSGSKDNRFLEISVWRYFNEEKATTGYHEFNYPKVGSAIEIFD